MSNLVKSLTIRIIDGYKVVLSPFIGRSCRFHPTCSDYTREAISKKGLVKGIAMGMWRILRCHPFSKGGYDPVS